MIKITLKLLSATVCLGLLLSTSALAANRQEATTMTPMIGYHYMESGLDVDSSASYGFALGYNFTPVWGIELDLRYTPTEFDGPGSQDVDVWTYSLGALYHFQPDQVLTPYLTAGLGGVSFDPDGSGSADEDFMGYWGGGFKYSITDTTALRFDIRHIIDARTDNNFDTQGDSTFRNHISAMFGATFQFGGF